jgi:serine/threonine-protein kinase
LAVATPRSGDLLLPGQRIGPFLLLTPLGSGGSGRVWAVARTGQLGFTKRMVLKVMRKDKLRSERARQRFDREARLGAQLRHAHLRGVHEVGSHEERPYMALSWVDASLSELLEHAPGRRLVPSVACWLAIQTCEALAAAHGHVNHAQQLCPIVHGDVSPGNILLTTQGHVLLADLAGATEPSAAQSTERPVEAGATPQHFFGSLGYASPEALKGLVLDGRSDLFSLGCVLYEMLCGSPAFEGDDERSIVYQVLEQEPPDVRQRAPEVGPELAAVLRQALARRVDERFQSASEMRAALRACVPGQGSFWLEERSANLIQRVLGERIRAREDEMRLVFQRFSASQFERTDTLPILSGASGRTSVTLRARTAESASERQGSRSSSRAAPSQPKPARWGLWAVLFLALTLAGGFLLQARGRAPVLQAAAPLPAQPASTTPSAAGSESTQQQAQQALRGSPGESGPAASGSPASGASTRAPPTNLSALPGATSPPSAEGAVDAVAPRRRAPAERRAPSAQRPSAPAALAPSQPSPPPRQPFQWHFPEDPYEGAAPAPPAKASADPGLKSAP